MAPATDKSSLNANAAPFIPGRREHVSFAPPSEPKTRYGFSPEALPFYPHGVLPQETPSFDRVGYYDAQHDFQLRDSRTYPYYPAHYFYAGQQGYYPIYSYQYPAYGAYYYYPQALAPAPWYPLNDTIYLQPAEPFESQLLEVENARMNLEMHDDDDDDDNKDEDDYEDMYEDNYEGSSKFGDWYQKQSGRNNNYRSARRGRRERRAAEKRAAEQSANMENDDEAERSGKGKEKAVDDSGW
ncbi:hypothetical protein N0V83_006592 [Neocucurbitaria cava]|uniref:Uncharacterized protein n=1 Tax=Neocucurbitaria cava TaxID=798079 RepID=A0A9W9CL51_9PLEO|nr:hypothetical protein N0V83_006592 [Neocucurbitaria cava]